VACSVLFLPIALGAAAVGLSLRQARELGLRAPIAARPFADLLTASLAQDDVGRVRALCERLRTSWAAELVRQCLDAEAQGENIVQAVEDATARAHMLAERHLYAIRTLGRIAVPLALGTAIVELGFGFAPSAGTTIAASGVQHALDCALRALATGFTTAVFCQVSVASLQRQAQARMAELHVVAHALTSQMRRTTR
jgi:hypothetical protein